MKQYQTRQLEDILVLTIATKFHKVKLLDSTFKNEAISRTKGNNDYYWRHSVILTITELEEDIVIKFQKMS